MEFFYKNSVMNFRRVLVISILRCILQSQTKLENSKYLDTSAKLGPIVVAMNETERPVFHRKANNIHD